MAYSHLHSNSGTLQFWYCLAFQFRQFFVYSLLPSRCIQRNCIITVVVYNVIVYNQYDDAPPTRFTVINYTHCETHVRRAVAELGWVFCVFIVASLCLCSTSAITSRKHVNNKWLWRISGWRSRQPNYATRHFDTAISMRFNIAIGSLVERLFFHPKKNLECSNEIKAANSSPCWNAFLLWLSIPWKCCKWTGILTLENAANDHGHCGNSGSRWISFYRLALNELAESTT